jgi:antitoxin FitA
MATLQVKNLDPDLHAALVQRARRERRTLSEVVTAMLKRELARPSLDDWVAAVQRGPRLDRDVDSVALLDEERGPWPDADRR